MCGFGEINMKVFATFFIKDMLIPYKDIRKTLNFFFQIYT